MNKNISDEIECISKVATLTKFHIETRGKDRWTRKYEEADSIFGRRNREEEEERSREKNNEFDYVSNAE